MNVKVFIGIIVGSILGGIYGYFGKCHGSLCMISSNPWTGALFGAAAGMYIVLVFRKTKK